MKYIRTVVICFITITAACADHQKEINPSDSLEEIIKDASTEDADIDTSPPDPCENASVSDGVSLWCGCHPQCCQSQLWFCPPIPGNPTYYKKEVIVDICDENGQMCMYGHDDACPPPEMLYSGECSEAYECPPGSQNLDYGWQWCEMSDGTVGKQQVTCDKGQLYHSPCQTCDPEVCDNEDNDCDGVVDEDLGVKECQTECGTGSAVCVQGEEVCFGPEPQEEICDYLDNDCDGEVDEFQLNDCGQCGQTPPEVCNLFDDDCDGETDEDLVKACSTACGTGVELCTGGSWSSCTAQQPTPEICDGLDNDCNGQIDDGIECLCTIQDVGSLFPCAESPLLCGQGFKTCECEDPGCQQIVTTDCFAACHWLASPAGSDPNCDSLVGMALEDETCNNFDDNCNQMIDEDLFVGCYTGPEGTIGVGICDPGLMTCLAGVWGGNDEQDNFIPGMCVDETVPQDEECNGLDDDCDGVVDWGEEVPETDILFIVDWSGSMNDEISAVLVALNQFAGHYSLQDKLHWGLIVGPRQAPGDFDERLYMISDISPFPDFLADFAGLGNQGMNTGDEMLLDAIYLALQNISGDAPIDLAAAQWGGWSVEESVPPKDQFNISWRPGADRVIVVFSDELPQSYLNPNVTPQQIITTGQATPQLKIYTFSTNESWQWDEIANACGGSYYPLSNNALEMYNYLMEILDEICMPPNPGQNP